MKVPFFRPSIGSAEIDEVVSCLRSGWLTSGPVAKRFEQEFARAVGGAHAVAVNSCTAALHLAVEALHLKPGDAVLVPTMTFAATAEIVRYQGAVPILVDCDPLTLNLDLADAERKLERLAAGQLAAARGQTLRPVGIIPVHVAGVMVDIRKTQEFADRHGLWMIEDAAHALPAAWRPTDAAPWQRCGEGTSQVACYSFYANKTITTGEGGMAVTNNADLASRMRMMSLHGLSHDAWGRYSGGSWDYRIVAPGYKYNLTDFAAAIGVHQLARAEEMRLARERHAFAYRQELAGLDAIELPIVPERRIHSWHLFPIRLRLDRLSIDRDAFIVELKAREIGCSVHWRPLHQHPYYIDQFGWTAEDCPVASTEWRRLVSLPLFPDLLPDERRYVVDAVGEICRRHAL
ncbi:MAG TPA: DegT/DnrJ/EryC1/StrS aminotransferase family protein [Pirellulales bacterium]|nr:DegT/DnrJ/EryC1/StrS aminotransferase family protein [Pirellulales bacterium]